MKLDEVAKKRFAELEEKAETIAKTREYAYEDIGGGRHFRVSPSEFAGWATSILSLLQRIFGEQSAHYREFSEKYQNSYIHESNEAGFEKCKAILHAAKEDYEGGYLFNIRALVKAEVFDDSLERAQELLTSEYKDSACVIAGIMLELALTELCTRQGIAHDKMDKMNTDLCKAGIYNMGKQKQITAWAELRNRAAHGDWNAYNPADVQDLIDGVYRFIADYV